MAQENQKYKIAIFSSDTVPYYHGSGRNAFHFAEALNAIGYQTDLISLNKLFVLPYKQRVGNTLVFRLPLWQRNKLVKGLTFPICFLFYVAHIWRSQQILLYGRIIGYELILLLAWLLRKPVFFQSTLLHADDLETITRTNYAVRWLGLTSLISGYFAINQGFADLSRQYLSPSAKIFISPQGVDMGRFTPSTPASKYQLRELYGIDADALIFVTIGIVCKRKGYTALFEQMAKLDRDFTLIVIGDHDPKPDNCFVIFKKEMQEIKQYGQQLLGSKVLFVGTTETPEDYLKLADYFIFNSDAEGTPNALLEAMSCKTPIICKQLEGTELFLNSKTAFVYGHDSDLLPTINEALNSTHSDRTEAAFRFCKSNCSLQSVAEAFIRTCVQ